MDAKDGLCYSVGMKIILAGTVAAAACMGVAGTVLLDFESEAERKSVPRVAAKSYQVGVTNRFATSGANAMTFACGKWSKGLPEWPSVTVKSPVSDWRAYDRLAIDLVSLGDGGDRLFIYIAGPDGRIQNGLHASVLLSGKGYSQWIVPIKEWPKTASPDNVARIHFYAGRPEGFSLAIDRLTLLAKGEQAPVPEGPCVGRDLLPLAACGTEEMRRKVADAEEWRRHVADYVRFREACVLSGQAKADMLLGAATTMEKVRPRAGFKARPLPAEGLAVRLARNEYEGVQLLVAPRDSDLEDVRVRVDGDLARGGERFAASNIACDVTGYVKTVRRPPYMVGRAEPTNAPPGYVRKLARPDIGWWPDPILGFLDGVDVRDQDVQSFWIRVRCPAGQPAGVYRGALVVSARGVAPVRVPFAVRVNDFALGRTSALPLAITFSPAPTTQWEDGAGLAAAKARREDPNSPVNMWRRHEREWVTFLADYLIPYDGLYHGSDLGRLRAIRQLKEEGRTGWFNLGYWSYPHSTNAADVAAWREYTIPRLVKFYEGAKAIGVQDYAYAYGCDEISPQYFPAIRAAVQELKKALPGVPISTTAYDHEFGVNTPLDVMDWFTPLTPKFDPAKAEASRKAGHQVWWYICCGPHAPHSNMFIECPAIEGRLLMGAHSVKMRPDGFLYYQISIWNSKRCITSGPFTDWDPRSWTTYHGDGSWTCVGPDGMPVPTVRLENFRDGLEDFAYAKLLERKIKDVECGKSKVDGREDWLRRAKELLAVPRSLVDAISNHSDDPALVYAWRDAMADLLETK